MSYRYAAMGFSSAFGIVLPVAVFRTAITALWIKHGFLSVVNFACGRGWESPSVGVGLNFPLYLAEAEAEAVEATYTIVCALNARLLASEIEASMPVVRFGEMCSKMVPTTDEEEPHCSVCLCDFVADDSVRQPPRCSHVFHKNCLDRWTELHQTCPFCRSSLAPDCLGREDMSSMRGAASSPTTGFSSFANQVLQRVLQRDAAGDDTP